MAPDSPANSACNRLCRQAVGSVFAKAASNMPGRSLQRLGPLSWASRTSTSLSPARARGASPLVSSCGQLFAPPLPPAPRVSGNRSRRHACMGARGQAVRQDLLSSLPPLTQVFACTRFRPLPRPVVAAAHRCPVSFASTAPQAPHQGCSNKHSEYTVRISKLLAAWGAPAARRAAAGWKPMQHCRSAKAPVAGRRVSCRVAPSPSSRRMLTCPGLVRSGHPAG